MNGEVSYEDVRTARKHSLFEPVDVDGHTVVILSESHPDTDSTTVACAECHTMRMVPTAVEDAPWAQVYLLGWFSAFPCDGVSSIDQNS